MLFVCVLQEHLRIIYYLPNYKFIGYLINENWEAEVL